MTTKKVGDSKFNLCVNCGGTWMGKDTLKELSGLDLSTQRSLNCPSCGDVLSIRNLRGVEVDYCALCDALWLDMGEMERISGIDPYVESGNDRTITFRDELQKQRNLEILRTEESADISEEVQIDDAFLSHVNGCIVAHATRRIKPQMDDDIMMAMLVAIQDFIKDSFKDEVDFLVERVDFGTKSLIISRGEYLVGAMVVAGGATKPVDEKLKAMIELCELRYKTQLKNWQGNLDDVRGIKMVLISVFDLH